MTCREPEPTDHDQDEDEQQRVDQAFERTFERYNEVMERLADA